MSRLTLSATLVGITVVAAGCVQPARQRVYIDPEPVRAAGYTKRIANDGQGGLILPDGSRVQMDQAGGFSLPNGDYVRRDASGALNLPNGSRCLPDGRGGFGCP
jgi:hypothetical protein